MSSRLDKVLTSPNKSRFDVCSAHCCLWGLVACFANALAQGPGGANEIEFRRCELAWNQVTLEASEQLEDKLSIPCLGSAAVLLIRVDRSSDSLPLTTNQQPTAFGDVIQSAVPPNKQL